MRNQIFLNAHLRFQVFAKIPVSRSAFNKLSSHFPAAGEMCFHLTSSDRLSELWLVPERSLLLLHSVYQRFHKVQIIFFHQLRSRYSPFRFFLDLVSVFSPIQTTWKLFVSSTQTIQFYIYEFILMIKCVELTSLSQRPCFSSSVQFDFREKPSH